MEHPVHSQPRFGDVSVNACEAVDPIVFHFGFDVFADAVREDEAHPITVYKSCVDLYTEKE